MSSRVYLKNVKSVIIEIDRINVKDVYYTIQQHIPQSYKLIINTIILH